MKLRISKTVDQKFSFEDKRTELEKEISNIQKQINDKQTPEIKTLQSLVYDSLTKRTHSGEDMVELRKTDPLYLKYGDAWKNWLQKSGADITGAWAQWNIGKRTKKDNKTYNFYITVDFSNEENFRKFWKALPDLHTRITAAAKSIGDGISFKVCYPFDGLINHNDSVKFYYSDPAAKSEVKQTVQDWAKTNNVILGKRAYEHGTDTDGTSFGDLAAKSLTKALVNGMTQNSNFKPSQWVNWLITYAPKALKDSH